MLTRPALRQASSLTLRQLTHASKPTSAFHTTPRPFGLKESDNGTPSLPPALAENEDQPANQSQDRDNLGAVYEAEKDDQVASTKEGVAKWKGELASNSEASVRLPRLILIIGNDMLVFGDVMLMRQVKADRGEVESDGKDMKEMQEKTKDLPNREGFVNKTQ